MLANLFKISTSSLPAETAAQYYAGYLWAVKQEDKRDEIVSCFKTDINLNDMLQKIMDADREGKTEDAKKLWSKAESHWTKSLKECTKDSIYDEYKALDQYTKDVMSRKDIDDFLAKRYTEYKAEIDQFSEIMLTRWDNGVYFDAGMYDGYIAQRMGLVESPYLYNFGYEGGEDGPERDMMGPAQFIAGWLYGVSGQTIDKRDAILSCFEPSTDLMNRVYHAMNQYIKGNKDKGDDAWKEAIELYKPALAGCDAQGITEPLQEFKQKMADMTGDKKWHKKSERIYNDNKAEIDESNKNQFKTWWEGVPFDSGMFAGRIDEVYLRNFMPSHEEPAGLHLF